MYRSPLLSERRRVLPGGGSGGALYYPHGNGSSARPARAQRFASLVLLAAITLGALAAQKVLVCDVAAAEGAQRETALVDSLKRLQGSLAARNAQGGASYTAYQARARQRPRYAPQRAARRTQRRADMRLPRTRPRGAGHAGRVAGGAGESAVRPADPGERDRGAARQERRGGGASRGG